MTTSTKSDTPEFNIFVEKVVRPIHVPTKRKRRMREELLAHMNGLHDEICGKDDLPEEQVVVETISRMGQPAELTEEFRGQENLWNRLLLTVEGLRYDPKRKFSHFLLKHLTLAMLVVLFVFVSSSISNFFFKTDSDQISIVFIFQLAGMFACFAFTFEAAFALLVDRISRAVYNLPLKPSKLATGFYFLLALLLIPSIASIVYLVFSYNNDAAIFNITLVICSAPMMPILLLIISKQAAEEIKYYEQWADLVIDE